MRISDFDFDLPDSQIAQHPTPVRGESRLLVLERHAGRITHATFTRLPEFLRRGDLLVLNDSRVFPARLLGVRVPSGGAVECLLVRALNSPQGTQSEWEALVHPGQKLKPGSRVEFEKDGRRLDGEIIDYHFHGRRTIRLTATTGTVMEAIERIGHIPLPPYIKRPDDAADRERYQTVFAREAGSIAAPTAGLHFTPAMLDTLRGHGIETRQVTLHGGYGTFKPVRVEQVEDHRVDPELFSVSADAAAALTRAQAEGRRIIAVGTTTTRVLETVADEAGGARAASGSTDLFIHPGHQFRLVGGLLTNFHLPRSSLLMLVSAFGGRDAVLGAYRQAVERGYRFYSYGDAMLLV